MDHTTNRAEAATDCDVLVIGGGLVGLTASMFLAQQGVRVTVVERHASTSIHPKARNLSIRTTRTDDRWPGQSPWPQI